MFKRIVFYQFYDFTRLGKDPRKARISLALLGSALTLLPLFTLFFLGHDWISTHFYCRYGLLAAGLLLSAAFASLFLFYGNKTRFERYLAEFGRLDEKQKREEAQKGGWYFLVPFFFLMALVLYLAYWLA